MQYDFDKQHKKNKYHALERINMLLDPDTFVEIGQRISNIKTELSENLYVPYDGVICGYGEINGNKVFIYSQDFTVCGGTVGLNHGKKIANTIKLAIENKTPIIGINDSGGARIQEGVNALAGYGEVFYYNTLASGVIPQISIIAGTCAGGAVYSPGITDFIFVIDKLSKMFVSGPKVIKQVTGQTYSDEALGGAEIHSKKSGVAQFSCISEEECYRQVKELVTILEEAKLYADEDCGYIDKDLSNVEAIVPEDPRKVYDMKNVILTIFDKDSFIEISKKFARNILIGFSKLSGRVVGIIANQPQYIGGILDCNSSIKAARFIRFCDAFNIPLITFVDVPGFMPDVKEEVSGIIRNGAKLLYAYAEATVPKISIILRKAYGGAYIAMCSKHLRADMTFTWPGAEIAVMGAAGAIEILYGKRLNTLPDEEKKIYIQKYEKEYQEKYINSKEALEEGYIDAEINPADTRRVIHSCLSMLSKKKNTDIIQKKHGNIPL